MSKTLKILLWSGLALVILLLAGGYFFTEMTDDFISPASAEKILLEKHSDAVIVDIETDSEDGNVIHEIEYTSGKRHHLMTIDGKTGKILADTADLSSQNTDSKNYSDPVSSGGSPNVPTENMDIDTATEIALKDAGFEKNEVEITNAELDKEDGFAVYEIEFRSENAKYEYKIDAQDGTIKSISTNGAG